VFSRRTAWTLEQDTLARAVADLHGDPDLLDLTISNPTAVGFTYPPEFYRHLTDERSARYDPDPFGRPDARAAVAAYYAARAVPTDHAAAAVDPANIGLCASTSEAYSHLLALLCDPGDVVLVPQPGYPLLRVLAELAGVDLVAYPLLYDGAWSIDLDALADLLVRTPRARALVVVAPNNPTGNYLRSHELPALDALLAASGVALIADEVFWDYPLAACERPTPAHTTPAALTFILSGLSKVAALPQLKLAWWLARGPEDVVAAARARLEVIADTFLGAATPVQHALPQLLAAAPAMQAQISRRTVANLASLRAACHAAAVSVLDVDAGWLALLRMPAVHDLDDAAWAARLLARRRVLVQPGHLYDLAGPHLAVSLLTPEAVLAAALDRLRDAVAEVLASRP
jgi:alanine-synthesizing transaminase